jgi:endonuclease YncB( thermonuclease family)
VLAHGQWHVFQDCRQLPNDSNDGDSFHVSANRRHYIFRLYFADAPETEESFPERVTEQAAYFKLTIPQTLELGNYARRFVEEKMRQPFTVRTCMQAALGRSNQKRFYAFVETKDGDLAELLVANGLARVHGSEATPVGLRSPELEWHKLQRLENEARQEKVGAWGAPVGRMTARSLISRPKAGLDSFDAFFHPEKLAVMKAAEERLYAQPVTIAPGAKLDPNTATATELENIRGIGPVLAGRIIAARPFKSSDDLRKVKGIGPKKYAQLRPYFF